MSNRFVNSNETLENIINNNSRILGDKEKLIHHISEYQIENNPIYLFDSDMNSKYWQYVDKNKFNSHKIIDGNFLIYVFLLNFIKNIFNLSKNNSFLILVIKVLLYKKKSKYKLSILKIIFICMMDVSISLICKKIKNYNLVAYSSNNLLSEILRAHAILDVKCQSLTELTHGALSYPTFEWYHSLAIIDLEFSKIGVSKQNIIQFVPNLPYPPDSYLRDIYCYDYFINPQLTSRYLEREKYKGGKLKYINYLENLKPDNHIVITIFGGTGLEENYYESFEYKLELTIIELITTKSKLENKYVKIYYRCHPANNKHKKNRLDILKSKGVEILDYSVDCFLVSDYIYSTISSCLFEFQWLGGGTICPLILEDKFYTKEFLQLIYHPKDDKFSSFNETLDVLFKMNDDQTNKIESRIKKLS